MKKFFENKPRAWFIIGSIFIVLITGLALGINYYVDRNNTQKTTEEPETITVKEESIKAVEDLLTTTGQVKSITDSAITITTKSKDYTFALNSDTTVNKNVQNDSAKITDIKVGQIVSVVYKDSTKLATKIWFETK